MSSLDSRGAPPTSCKEGAGWNPHPQGWVQGFHHARLVSTRAQPKNPQTQLGVDDMQPKNQVLPKRSVACSLTTASPRGK